MDARSKSVLEDVRAKAVAGRVVFTNHARQRLYQRNVEVADVESALMNGRTCRPADGPEKWKVEGPDVDGDDLAVVVAVEADVIVVTVF